MSDNLRATPNQAGRKANRNDPPRNPIHLLCRSSGSFLLHALVPMLATAVGLLGLGLQGGGSSVPAGLEGGPMWPVARQWRYARRRQDSLAGVAGDNLMAGVGGGGGGDERSCD